MSGERWKHSSGPEGRIPWRIEGQERNESRFVCNSTVAITDSSDAYIREAATSQKQVETSVEAGRKLGNTAWRGRTVARQEALPARENLCRRKPGMVAV